MFPVQQGVYRSAIYITYPLHRARVLLHRPYTCTSTTSAFVRLYFSETIYSTIKVGVASIQGNESRRKVTESHASYPPGSFKGRTKGLPPSFPINLYALPHTRSMATSVAHVTYLIWLWDCFLWGMSPFSGGWGGGVLSGRSPWQIKGGCWYLSWVSVILSGWKADKWTEAKMSEVEVTCSESANLHWWGIEFWWFDTGDSSSLSGLR